MKILVRRALAAGLVLAGFAAPAAANAHDIWLTPVKQDAMTVAHVRYGDPSRLEFADARKIVSLELISADGRVNLKAPLTMTTRGPAALVSKAFAAPASGAVLAVSFDNGFWAVDPADGVQSNTSKLMVANPKKSWWVPKFGKTLLGPGAHGIRAETLLELTALADPYGVAIGQTLAVRLDYRGRPLAGVNVTYGDGVAPVPEKDRPVVKTDADGVARIPIARKGAYLLTAEHLTAASRPDLSQNDELYATLAFDTGR